MTLPSIILSIPPAAKTLAIIGAVYGVLQAAKKVPALTEFLTGWVAVVFNVLLTAGGMLVAIPADQLYTTNTLVLLLTTILGAAGVHGTVKSFSQPQVLASIPPDPQVKEVPAKLEPIDPTAVLAKPDQPPASTATHFPFTGTITTSTAVPKSDATFPVNPK